MAIVLTPTAVSNADAYFFTRLNSPQWAAANEVSKLAALTTAANFFNSMHWKGKPVSTASAFPRYLDERSVAETPPMLLWGLYEQALHFLINPDVLNEESSVDSLSVGSISLSNIKDVRVIPRVVYRYIAPYTASSGVTDAHSWWRAN